MRQPEWELCKWSVAGPHSWADHLHTGTFQHGDYTASRVLHVHARVVPNRDVAARVLNGKAAQRVDHLALHHVLSVPVPRGWGGVFDI